jgi:hypothetical protein
MDEMTVEQISLISFVFTLLIIILPLLHARQSLAHRYEIDLTRQLTLTTSGFKNLKCSGYYTGCPKGKGHSIGSSKQKSVYVHVYYYERFPR